MEITVALVIRQIITAVLISVGIAVVYSGLILVFAPFLRSIWKFGDDPNEVE